MQKSQERHNFTRVEVLEINTHRAAPLACANVIKFLGIFFCRTHLFLAKTFEDLSLKRILKKKILNLCYGIFDHMDVGLVMTSLGASFSVLSWHTHT